MGEVELGGAMVQDGALEGKEGNSQSGCLLLNKVLN